MDGAVKLLKELLTIRSVNGRDDEGAVAEYLCKYFEQSGISAHIQRIDATHANVLAELEGESDDAPIFWNGHLDTVPYGDTGEWKTDPAVPVERDGFLYGRGASDMKSLPRWCTRSVNIKNPVVRCRVRSISSEPVMRKRAASAPGRS